MGGGDFMALDGKTLERVMTLLRESCDCSLLPLLLLPHPLGPLCQGPASLKS